MRATSIATCALLVALAEPALLIIMASLIGTVVVGMLLPIFTLQGHDQMNRMNNHKTRPAAFTLIELLLVLVILGVLALVVVPKFAGRSEEARKTAARTDVSMLEGQIDIFEQDCGRFPSNDEGLGVLVTQPRQRAEVEGPVHQARRAEGSVGERIRLPLSRHAQRQQLRPLLDRPGWSRGDG
jgi:prepilin-type N-terminal cleavage/methylation domain-containing protein